MSDNPEYQVYLSGYVPFSAAKLQHSIDIEFGTHLSEETRQNIAAAISSSHKAQYGCLAVMAAMTEGRISEGDGHSIMTTEFLPMQQDPRQYDVVWQD